MTTRVFPSICWLVILLAGSATLTASAQTSLNVTDFGAKGDAEQVWVTTTSNSAAVVFTNTLSSADIGKTVELFDVGQPVNGPDVNNSAIAGWIQFNNLSGSNCMRVLGVITNISGNNVYVQPQTVYTTPIPATGNAMRLDRGGGMVAVITNTSLAQTLYQTPTPIDTNLIGKSIDIWINASFSVDNGPYIGTSGGCYIYANPFATHYQSVIATITNVSGNTAYLSGDLPGITTTNAYCIYGTDNASAFQAAVDATSGTNVTINVPAGTFLMLPGSQYTNHVQNVAGVAQAFIIRKGGFELVGAGRDQTVLMACGAWKQKSGWFVYSYDQTNPRSSWQCERGMIFSCVGPITNNYPLAFRKLTFDGGMPLALTWHQGNQPANPFDGLGWDGTSAAGQDSGSGALNSLKTFDACEFRHFMSEMIKGITGTDGNGADTVVSNCVFWDGNATAFNYNTSHTITGCTFSDMFQIEEFYLKYSNVRPSYFINNFATNIFHNFVSLNGGTLTNQPYVISNNVLYGSFGGNAIASCPAANVTVANNTIIGSSGAFLGAVVIGQNGAQPGDPDACNKNWNIYGNTFSNCAYALEFPEGLTIADNNHADGVWFHNNTLFTTSDTIRPILAYGQSTNVFFYSNTIVAPGANIFFNSSVYGGPEAWVSTNNDYRAAIILNGERGPTNYISYDSGSRYIMRYPYDAAVKNVLVAVGNVASNQVVILLTNASANSLDVPIHLNSINGSVVTVPFGHEQAFYWTGKTWRTNAVRLFLAPPTDLHIN